MTDSPLTEARVNEMLAGLEGVTEGPWMVAYDDETECPAEIVQQSNWDHRICFPTSNKPANAAHIARCDPSTIRQLCEAWKRDAGRSADDAYDRGRRDILNALLALNPKAAQKLHALNGGTEETFRNHDGRLPFDVVLWVTEVAEQLGIKSREEMEDR